MKVVIMHLLVENATKKEYYAIEQNEEFTVFHDEYMLKYELKEFGTTGACPLKVFKELFTIVESKEIVLSKVWHNAFVGMI